MLGGAQSDQIAKLEELSLMIRDLAPAPPTKAPWIPEPALAFAQTGLTFMPVPAHTGGWGCQASSGICTPSTQDASHCLSTRTARQVRWATKPTGLPAAAPMLSS